MGRGIGEKGMTKLTLLVCENYLPEFRSVVEDEGYEDIELDSFSSFCDGGIPIDTLADNTAFHESARAETVLICSRACPASRMGAEGGGWFGLVQSAYCYSQLIGDQFARFFIEEGYYTVTTGWLSAWEKHLERQGFTRETAREFYRGWCRKLVYLDSGLDDDADFKLNALSDYLGIPVKHIPVSLDSVRALVRNKLYEWRLKHSFPQADSNTQLREMQEQNAKNAAVLTIMSRIAAAEYKREVISMLEEVWLFIFGATRTRFWSCTDKADETPDHVRNLPLAEKQSFLLDRTSMTFYARLESGGENFGILEVGGFIFPQNIEKYTDLFDSVIKIASLAISNAQRYEDLTASKNRYEHSSHHDEMTGLYNRTYYKKLLGELSSFHPGGVFAVDIDGLKDINDSLGHAAGDEIIKSAAEALKKTFRASDYIIRMGGDEFVVIVMGCDSSQAEQLDRRLRKNITGTHKAGSPELEMSLGIAVTETSSDTLESMVHQADFAMYENKRKRKEKGKAPGA
jgi:diguanylate cyclase (GGDEF)-like protein